METALLLGLALGTVVGYGLGRIHRPRQQDVTWHYPEVEGTELAQRIHGALRREIQRAPRRLPASTTRRGA